MKQFLTLLAIIALFLVSCSKDSESVLPASDANDFSSLTVKSDSGDDGSDEGDVDENEAEAETETEVEGEGDGQGDIDQEDNDEDGEEEEQEPELTPEELIALFVATHFPETAIASSEEDEEECGRSIKLEDGTHIVFDSNYDWKKVDCKHSTVYTSVPDSIVPEDILAYVVENYPENTIMDIKKVGFGIMVRLNNKTKLKFGK